MYIIVVGGGKVGYYLTKSLLAEGHEVLLIERAGDKVDAFVERFGKVVIQGDGAEAAVLAAAGAARADVVIAVTGEDEDNLVVCQMARQKFHVGRTIARVNNPKNEALFKKLGIDVTVSQTNFILTLIEQSIPEKSFVHLLSLKFADLAMVEARVSDQSPVIGKLLSQINLPDKTVVAAVARDGRLFVPSASTELRSGDDLIAITQPEQEDSLRRILGCDNAA